MPRHALPLVVAYVIRAMFARRYARVRRGAFLSPPPSFATSLRGGSPEIVAHECPAEPRAACGVATPRGFIAARPRRLRGSARVRSAQSGSEAVWHGEGAGGQAVSDALLSLPSCPSRCAQRAALAAQRNAHAQEERRRWRHDLRGSDMQAGEGRRYALRR